jgi:choline-sulfatase
MGRPNILLVMFDQMAALSLPAYGHPLVRTPFLDRLAARGTVLERAYCAAPLCSPSRFAMLSGCLPSRIGAFDNAAELPSSVPSLPHYLRDGGYRTCLAGKMDFTGADQLHGYEERLTTDLSPSDFGWTPDWDRPEVVEPWHHTLQSVAEAGPSDYSLALQYDEEACGRAVEWLHRQASRPDGRPFMLTASFTHPHDPYLGPRRHWDLYDEAAIDMPVLGRQDDAAGRRMHRLYDRGEHCIGPAEIRRARRAYYAMIGYCDELLGRLLATLEWLGLDGDTIVLVTSDHGDMLGERGLWYKMVCFERAMRVPLIAAGPGIAAGARVAPAVSQLDLLPTLVELASGTPFAAVSPVDGLSLAAVLAGRAQAPGEVLAEYAGEGYDGPVVMIRRGDRKLVYSRPDGPALYDLAADPLESIDLAWTPGHAAEVAALVAEAGRRWDLAALDVAVRDSQRRRRLIHRALQRGRVAPWDYEPRQDPAAAYYRNYAADAPDPERPLRLPRVPPVR